MAMDSRLSEMIQSTSSPEEAAVSAIIAQYLIENSQTFKELAELRAKGWNTTEGDQFFENRRAQSDNANRKTARSFFHMTCQIGDELDRQTSVISLATKEGNEYPRVLDIGMAPGGFTQTVLRKHHAATIRGITLPQGNGGLEVMLPRWKFDHRISIKFLDVTMLANEMGRPMTSIPTTHPDVANFSSAKPFEGENFDLIFCGATAQRAHARADYRGSRERLRLFTSQLVVALQRLRDHGSLVLVMHKAEACDTARIIHTFTKFSCVRLFKPKKKHAVHSSFYMVATKVDVQSEEAQAAIHGWKMQWDSATFQSEDALSNNPRVSNSQVYELLAEFGPQLIRLATPVWKIQANKLRAAPFLQEHRV